jgi:hypothetical protein
MKAGETVFRDGGNEKAVGISMIVVEKPSRISRASAMPQDGGV